MPNTTGNVIAQAKVARLAGAMYLITMATAIFTQGVVLPSLIVSGNATQTAQNILESERLFRIAIAGDLITFIGVVVLTWALYVLLRPINRDLAMLAVLLRIVEVAVHYAAIVNPIVALRLLSNTSYLNTFETSQLQSLARLAISTQGTGINIGFLLLGLGSAVFAYLLLKSHYIPKTLAALGVFASLGLASAILLGIIFPEVASLLRNASFAPMGIYEITLGFWLLIKGVKIKPSSNVEA